MWQVEAELDRYLNFLRIEIRRQGYTQLEIQQTLGWGRSYISQLLTKQKGLRVDHVLLILKAIDTDPVEFFGEIYGWHQAPGGTSRLAPARADSGRTEALRREIQELKGLFQGLAELLVEKRVIDGEELMAAVQAERVG